MFFVCYFHKSDKNYCTTPAWSPALTSTCQPSGQSWALSCDHTLSNPKVSTFSNHYLRLRNSQCFSLFSTSPTRFISYDSDNALTRRFSFITSPSSRESYFLPTLPYITGLYVQERQECPPPSLYTFKFLVTSIISNQGRRILNYDLKENVYLQKMFKVLV